VATTRSRPRGREQARPSTGGVAAEHATKIYTVATVGIVVIVAFLALTSIGHVIDLATQHFMLFYAGVVSLMLLCTSVALGLIATDRMFLHPGQRVFVQAAHRAASFGAVVFLIIHVVTELLAQRVHVIDAFVPFLSPFKTFYIGLGTIAGDIFILLAITGIMRGRFNANGKAWRWRAIHYLSYVAFVFGIWHGLLGGRPAKPYYDWTYGVIVTFTLGGLAVRVLSNSLRPKENLSAPPVDLAANSASAPLRAAAMLAQYGGTRVGRTSILGAGTGSQPVMSAPLSAPVLTALPVGDATAVTGQQPYYEPGYEGPPRYLGAPRATGTGPMPQAATGPLPRAATGPIPTATMPLSTDTGPLLRTASGPIPRTNSGPMPRPDSGPMPRNTGSMPRVGSDPYLDALSRTGSMSQAATGPLPRADEGRLTDRGTGPRPRPSSGSVPGGAAPRGATGPRPRPTGQMAMGSGPYPAMGSGPYPAMDSGSYPAAGSGPYPAMGSGSYPAMGSGSYPAMGSGSYPAMGSGSYPAAGSGPYPAMGSGSYPAAGSGPYPRPATGSIPQADVAMSRSAHFDGFEGRSERQGWPDAGHDGSRYPEQPQWDNAFPETDPNLRYREPGPGMPGYRGSREQRYGGDRY
jgi:DMSO/TMAO reductase YedYZ heme-binding membrane subunit